MFGFDSPFQTMLKAYAIYDHGHDVLGGLREMDFQPTQWRDRFLLRHQQEFGDFEFWGQAAYLSDRNFLEAYYKYEFDQGLNNETFSELIWRHGIVDARILGEPNWDRPWVTETQWLPRVDAHVIGQSFFDMFTYNTWVSAAQANLHTFELPTAELSGLPPSPLESERPISTARMDWFQQVSMPFSAGAFRLNPYANVDLTYYSHDYTSSGEDRGRFYGGGGIEASIPFSRLYPDVESDLFNVQGINHKIVYSANYYNAYSSVPYYQLPQLDRMNDDAMEESLRDERPYELAYLPGPAGAALTNLSLYDPRNYAIRRLLDNRVDTLDTIQEVQGEISQAGRRSEAILGWSIRLIGYRWIYLPHTSPRPIGTTSATRSLSWSGTPPGRLGT